MQTHGDRAVVLGGSMAGLLAARVLADAYAEVVGGGARRASACRAHRRGVPQSRHIHGLLAGGQQALEELFDGLTPSWSARRAGGDMLEDLRCLLRGSPTATWPVRPAGGAGEPADARGSASVPGCVPCRRWSSSTGATSRDSPPLRRPPRHRRAGGPQTRRQRGGDLAADLVVDATGRGSRTPAWLETLGYPRPPVERVADRHRVRQPDLPA